MENTSNDNSNIPSSDENVVPTSVAPTSVVPTSVDELLNKVSADAGFFSAWTDIEWVELAKNLTDFEINFIYGSLIAVGVSAILPAIGIHGAIGQSMVATYKQLVAEGTAVPVHNLTQNVAGQIFLGGSVITGALYRFIFKLYFMENFFIICNAIFMPIIVPIAGAVISIRNALFGPSFSEHILPLLKSIKHTWENDEISKKMPLDYFYNLPITKYNLGIEIPIYSKDFVNDKDLNNLFHITRNNGTYFGPEILNPKVKLITVNLTVDQVCSLFRHELNVYLPIPFLFNMIAKWNQKKENLLGATQTPSINLFQDFLYKRDDTYSKTSNFAELDDKSESDGSFNGRLICRGPLFVGYLVTYGLDEKGIEIVKPYNENGKLTDIPVYMKENGWFTTGQKDGFINCNPLKKIGEHSCWEPQLHDVNGEHMGFYFLTMLYDAPWHDVTNAQNCNGPLKDIVVPETNKLAPTPAQNGGSKIYKITYNNI